MSLTAERMMTLMAYVDGELEAGDRVAAEAMIASDVDAARFVADLRTQASFVREGHDDRFAAKIAAFDVAEDVIARLDAPSRAPVVSIGAARSARDKRTARVTVFAGITAALAAAAALALIARGPAEAPLAKGDPTRAPANEGPASPASVEVETVQAAGQSVSVFYLPGASELTTSVVVWVDETGEK
jgi:anti-sigma factor RsiW